MEKQFRDKFECKILLNNAIYEKEISKKNLEWILKYIFKTNLFLVKHYQICKKYIFDEIYSECNELLKFEYFMNDKILMIWIARKLNHMIKINYTSIGIMLEVYLEEKK